MDEAVKMKESEMPRGSQNMSKGGFSRCSIIYLSSILFLGVILLVKSGFSDGAALQNQIDIRFIPDTLHANITEFRNAILKYTGLLIVDFQDYKLDEILPPVNLTSTTIDGYNISISPNTIYLFSGRPADFFLFVDVPSNAIASTQKIMITATINDNNQTYFGFTNVTVIVNPYHKIILWEPNPDIPIIVSQGDNIKHSLMLSNIGNIVEIIDIYMNDSRGILRTEGAIYITTVTVPNNTTVQFTIVFHIRDHLDPSLKGEVLIYIEARMKPNQNGTFGESHPVYWAPLMPRSWWEELSLVQDMLIALCIIGLVSGGLALIVFVRKRSRNVTPKLGSTTEESTTKS